jgi:hypothetical protein
MNRDFQKIQCIFNKTINDILDFITSNKKYKIEIVKLKKEYNIELDSHFNIFTAFSDFYYRENLHSDIIKYIFDPHTEKIGNSKYMRIFKNYIENGLGKKIELDLNTITIEREKDKIDILIKDCMNNCILVENKINNADDMNDQLGRYYTKLLKRNYSIKAIIYLTLSPLKKLDRNYSIKDLSVRKDIENILLEIPVVNKIGGNNFVGDVIDKCANLSNSNIVSNVFLKEYSELLKYLGGNFMAVELNTRVMYEIFEDKDVLNSFRIFGNLWDNRCQIIGKVFKDYFQNELGFLEHSDDVDNVVYKKIKDDINIGYATDFSFGFVHTPDTNQINSVNRKLFKELIENENMQKYFTEDKFYDDKRWVSRWIDYNKVNCLNDLKVLLEKFEKIIKEKL